MVCAILAGRKTQTRRVVTARWLPHDHAKIEIGLERDSSGHIVHRDGVYFGNVHCPYGAPGDQLWVRETWCSAYSTGCFGSMFAADGAFVQGRRRSEKGPHYNADDVPPGIKWRPSIHMPRWASRIILAVTDVRVERLQDISEADAEAEGIERGEDFFQCPTWRDYQSEEPVQSWFPDDPIGSFHSLWDSINGSRPACSWDDNPWVWVVEFSRIGGNA